MKKTNKIKKKECIFRHGPFKTVRLIEHTFKSNAKDEEGFTVKRILSIEQCETCGKIIMQNSNNY